ncbi:MAG: hypothetical protein V4623_04890 [Pseudomonadota bacterium]
MADHLTHKAQGWRANWLAAPTMLLACLSGGAYPLLAVAQTSLSDPTQALERPYASTTADEAGDGALLQSVIIRKQGKPSALIGGQLVELGGQYGTSRLIGLSENEAVLAGPNGVERLLLNPNLKQPKTTPVKPTAPRKRTTPITPSDRAKTNHDS